jgi:indole-3-glycerol phosphate synthase
VNPEAIRAIKWQALAARKSRTPIEAIRALASMQKRPQPVLSTVTGGMSTTIIGQIARTSAAAVYDPVASALRLLRAGADALALLTDDSGYERGLNDLTLVARAVNVPIICQDYIFDEYQIVELRAAGASGVVLYADMLDCAEVRALISAAQRNRMTAIVQVTGEGSLAEVAAFSPQAVVIGTGGSLTLRSLSPLRQLIPAHIHTVIADRLLDLDDVRAAASLRPDAVIAGAALLEQPGGTNLLRQILNPSL